MQDTDRKPSEADAKPDAAPTPTRTPEPSAAPNVGGGEKASQADAQPGDIEELDKERANGA
ncbi:hypothetical protein [Hansschlegelia sp. KR7-227]|uniref:hypothetical protein n=1 Tax=Hansschlegelia sp. KR7-227 TaxID=3400914 RepID=UPI003C0991DA